MHKPLLLACYSITIYLPIYLVLDFTERVVMIACAIGGHVNVTVPSISVCLCVSLLVYVCAQKSVKLNLAQFKTHQWCI